MSLQTRIKHVTISYLVIMSQSPFGSDVITDKDLFTFYPDELHLSQSPFGSDVITDPVN